MIWRSCCASPMMRGQAELLRLHRHGGAPDSVEVQDVRDERIEVHRLELRSGQSRIVAKFVDQALHRIDLVHDGLDRLGKHRLPGAGNLA